MLPLSKHNFIVKISERTSNVFTYKYLVESCGELLLVCRVYNEGVYLETVYFEIYKLDVDHMAWKKIKNLGDRMFLGKCCSISLSPKQLRVGISNFIYFANCIYYPAVNQWQLSSILGGLDRILKGSCLMDDDCKREDWVTFHFGNEICGRFSFRRNIQDFGHIWLTHL
ncbi:hypothetical protein CFOL_v3_04425 [Cephalotus follicularis]|uniref:KIB1-4 beta-propeller domain-containing protein n=1 Tax=Cephalotus follicularis TaxID=3775 RepID=A0A1Q3AYT3_CEPFO|nr:hypothetical protein CFOL_v3_04425 [Cephalotus follicularis]